MHIKKERARQCGMDQVLINRVAEPVHDDAGDQQRHQKIEIVLQYAVARGCPYRLSGSEFKGRG